MSAHSTFRIQLSSLLLGLFVIAGCETTKPTATNSADNRPTAEQRVAANTAAIPAPNVSAPAPPIEPVAPVAPIVPKITPEQHLAEGSSLFDKGDYRGAIRRLTQARDASDASASVKQSSLKLLAFSYCVTAQRPLCKSQFNSLLRMNPDFQLTRSEVGHPLWGPVFQEAKAEVIPRPAKKS